ncbi:hypothetical protein ACTNEY_08340 [Fusicatenibacter saccharivorans]|uniref:hypothetical protein n=1 Tax=Fusicatenibacter saccharivorans TaxID=1150298 RepID=UPI003F8B716E
MKFSQLIKKIGYDAVVNVYRVTTIEHDEEGTTDITSIPVGSYRRYNRVPKEIWEAPIYNITAEGKSVLAVMIEDMNYED